MALVRLDLTSKPFMHGKRFGDVGAYEALMGEAEFAVDPAHPLNTAIVDLELAPRDVAGKIHFTADVRILRPGQRSLGNRGLFLDVVNRGNSIFARMLEPGPLAAGTGVSEGFLLRRGFTVVTCGWQHDIPRTQGLFGLSAPEAPSVGASVTGVGFMALRDLLSHLKTGGYNFSIALGASQSGRLLRHMVYLGMSEAEDGTLALDGVLAVAAGARMTEANLRFGEPSSNGPKTGMFPFTYTDLLRSAAERGKIPKVIQMDTSSEYCSSSAEVHVSAAMTHASADRQSDLGVPDNVRHYLCASTQHAPAPLGAPADGRGRYPPNTIDYKPFVRAAVDNLTEWVTHGVAPPPNAYPRFTDGTLTADLCPSNDDDGNEVAGLRHPDVSVPLATYTGWSPSATGGDAFVRALGSTMAFSPEVIAARYPSREVFLARIREAASRLVSERYLLDEDVEPQVAASARRWDLQVPESIGEPSYMIQASKSSTPRST